MHYLPLRLAKLLLTLSLAAAPALQAAKEAPKPAPAPAQAPAPASTTAPSGVAALPPLAVPAGVALEIGSIDKERILKAADAALTLKPLSITQFKATNSPAGPHDYYSNGDYWWPDPSKPDGLPYIQKDGQSNPANFSQHRMALRNLRDAVAALGAAYRITGDDKYAAKASELLAVFFLNPDTMMNPNLQHAQTVPGAFPDGRGIGIIDTLHLIEVPVAVAAMQKSPAFKPEVATGLKKWFQDYLDWMITSKNGKEEAATKNNHAVAFWLQAAVFANFTGDQARLAEAKRQFKEVFLPNQMAQDGGFPAELKRTKPYAYSIFQLDNMTTLCRVLSTPQEDLWAFELPDGRGIRKAVDYLRPYLADKSSWPLKPDVQAWEGWPTRQSAFLFAGLAYNDPKDLDLWQKLKPDPADEEIQRNIAITQPVLWVDPAPAQGAATLPTKQALDTGWEYYQGSLGSIWEIWRGDKATDNVTWKKVTLPHCFNGRDSVDPDNRYYQGPGWYRTTLKVSNPYANGRTLLHFNGAGQKTEVYVGLEKVGSHNGGYDEWSVDITDAVAKELAKSGGKGEVQVAVRCDNSRDAESIPSDLSDFNRYGGIYRHLYLVYVPRVSVERVHVEPVLQLPTEPGKESKATVKIRARLYNPNDAKEPLALSLTVKDPGGKVIHTADITSDVWQGEKELDSFEITAPKLWSPKSPALYSCSVALKSPAGDEETSGRFGIRSVEWVEHGPLKLNGERLLLRGTHYHEDHAGVAAAVPDEVARQTLVAMKEMGVNFVRLGHYQQAPLVLDLCDELGILAWEEAPWCRGGLGGDGYKKQALDMLGAMIDQHYNHPSIILWGMGNENDWPGDFPVFDKEAIRSFMKEMNATSHKLDPSRKTAIRRCDFCKDLVDVYSPSIWAGWYSGRYSEYRDAVQKWIKQVPYFFHAEYGGDSHARRHSEDPEKFLAAVETGKGTAEVGSAYKGSGGAARPSKDGDWSESYIINLVDWHLKEQEQMPNLTGAAQWIFKDFATPLRPENPVPRVNQKGLVERDGTPKESYYVYQSYWADKPMVHIYGHTWPVRWGKAGEEKQVKVFSNCPEVELFVNGVSAGVKKREVKSYPASGLAWNVKFNPGTNTLRAVGKKDGTTVTDEIRQDYQTETWEKPAKLLLKEVSRADGTVTVEVTARDQKGVLCLDAANLVRFGVAGDAVLLDNLGTSTGSRAVQLYNGRARISIRGTGPKAVATVSGEGLPTEYLDIAFAKDAASSGTDSQGGLIKTLLGRFNRLFAN